MEDYESVLRNGLTAITVLNFGEALDRSIRGKRIPEPRVRAALDPLPDRAVMTLDVDLRHMRLAVALRSRHHQRATSALSLADCVCLAAAVVRQAPLATGDRALLAAAGAEGLDTVALTPA